MPQPDSVKAVLYLDLPDEAATAELAGAIAERVAALMREHADSPPAMQIQLQGDLGAGKTTFARALLRALGHVGRVKSPTYSLCEPYELSAGGAPLTVFHFDLYRLGGPDEWADAGFRDCFRAGALCLVEWPERAAGQLCAPDLLLELSAQEDADARKAMLTAGGAHGTLLLPLH
ncbi:MAG: tRNA (adenosine(37)-N6)-threonylcarbamoyltransferase complex ATPase subunit type 1 TsaE [Candidatus Protistobacter heckmanni]|nr:tRNA (adenosine(37)-N6)-threonylcarbamoyltransferase complex ATPase subunit type 1 TsaE [Candidatus Protistobacter heckmanni]